MQVVASISYERGVQIGKNLGANSRVYLIDEPQLGGQLVAKEIDKKNFSNPVYFTEAQAMFATPHPNVVPIQYACDNGTHICLVMPYYKKGCLSQRIARSPLPVGEAIAIAVKSLAGLARIHAKNFAHLDIKPSNILFSDADEPMIADFGQARAIGSGGWVMFPPVYPKGIPPEFYATGVATILADIYHFGLLMYRAVNGDAFFLRQVPATQAERERLTLAGKFPNRGAFLPHVPNSLRRIIKRALSVRVADRYQSATELSKAIGRVQVKLDWHTVIDATGAITWRAKRPGQPDLVVDLLAGTSARGWDIAVHTDGAGGRRAKRRDLHQQGVARAAAFHHLKVNVFPSLE